MPHSIPAHVGASHREQLASVRPTQAKAEIKTQVEASPLRELAAEAIRATSGNARAAAIDLDIHEGHLSRQLKDGTLRIEQLETLGAPLLAELGRMLVEAYGPLRSPDDHALELIARCEDILDAIKQYVEHNKVKRIA